MHDQRLAYLRVTESAPNTLSFGKLEDDRFRAGWLVTRVDCFVSRTEDFVSDYDSVEYGISVMHRPSAVFLEQRPAAAVKTVTLRDWQGATTEIWEGNPRTRTFPGGIMLPPSSIYVFVHGVGVIAPQVVSVRVFYNVIKLESGGFRHLLEQRDVIVPGFLRRGAFRAVQTF